MKEIKGKNGKLIIKVLLVAAAIALRLAFFDYQTLDYIDFLSKWVQFFRNSGGFAALNMSVGNYNIPYLYFLAFFSYLPVKDLYLIKLLSCLFDFLLAYACGKLVRLCGGNEDVGFFSVLFLPTVVINGAVWAQCDSSYAALALLGLAVMLENSECSDSKGCAGIALMAAAFGFKLQAVFILPVCLILLFARRIKWWHFFAFPLTYLLMIMPAVVLGRPFLETLTLYFDQAGSVGDAPNYNAPSLTALTQSPDSTTLIIFAFAAMMVLLLAAWFFRKKLTDRAIVIYALLLSTVIPFLLPHMHDRYFFMADVLSLVLACFIWQSFPAAVLQQFGSLICYLAYLTRYYLRVGNIYLTNDRGAVAVLLALMIETAVLILEHRKNAKNPRSI